MARRAAGIIDAGNRLVRLRGGRQRRRFGDQRLHCDHIRWRGVLAHIDEWPERWLGARELGGAPLVSLVAENDRTARVAGAVAMLGDRTARVHRHPNPAKPPCRVPTLKSAGKGK